MSNSSSNCNPYRILLHMLSICGITNPCLSQVRHALTEHVEQLILMETASCLAVTAFCFVFARRYDEAIYFGKPNRPNNGIIPAPKPPKPLQIPPIRPLQHQRPASNRKRRRKVVVRINKKDVGCRFIAPLKTSIEVDDVLLIIILNKCGEEQFVSHGYIYAWTNQPKSLFVPGFR